MPATPPQKLENAKYLKEYGWLLLIFLVACNFIPTPRAVCDGDTIPLDKRTVRADGQDAEHIRILVSEIADEDIPVIDALLHSAARAVRLPFPFETATA